jgi:hypothetical protein
MTGTRLLAAACLALSLAACAPERTIPIADPHQITQAVRVEHDRSIMATEREVNECRQYAHEMRNRWKAEPGTDTFEVSGEEMYRLYFCLNRLAEGVTNLVRHWWMAFGPWDWQGPDHGWPPGGWPPEGRQAPKRLDLPYPF